MHVDHRHSNTVGRPWVAVHRRRSTRRNALVAALGLLVATLALPVVATPPSALAADGPKTFTAQVPEAVTGIGGTFDLDLRLDNTSPRRGGGSGRELGSANVTIASGPATFLEPPTDPRVKLVDQTIEMRDLGLLPQDDGDYGLRLTANCGITVTFDVVAKQSNDFQGAGNELTLQENGSQLTVTLECGPPPYLDGLDVADCENDCSVTPEASNGHRLSASADSNQGALYAGFRAAVNDGFAIEQLAFDFFEACRILVADRANSGEPYRLAGEVAQVEPVGLVGGDVTVRMTIPRSEVNTDENRSADVFTVCFLGDRKAFDDVLHDLHLYQAIDGPFDLDRDPFLPRDDSIGNPDLYGPVLLPLCELTDWAAPCIESRQKVRADVELTVRIRASDPWMR